MAVRLFLNQLQSQHAYVLPSTPRLGRRVPVGGVPTGRRVRCQDMKISNTFFSFCHPRGYPDGGLCFIFVVSFQMDELCSSLPPAELSIVVRIADTVDGRSLKKGRRAERKHPWCFMLPGTSVVEALQHPKRVQHLSNCILQLDCKLA